MFRKLIRQIAHSIFLLFVLSFLNCCTQDSSNAFQDNNEKTENAYLKEVLIKMLRENNLSLQKKKRIDSLHSPLRLSQRYKLLSLNNIKVKEYWHERWSFDNDYVDIWTINFFSMKDLDIVKSKIDSLCNMESVQKDIFIKNFRGYKYYGSSLVLLKHDFFSEEKINQYQNLVEYIKKDNLCLTRPTCNL